MKNIGKTLDAVVMGFVFSIVAIIVGAFSFVGILVAAFCHEILMVGVKFITNMGDIPLSPKASDAVYALMFVVLWAYMIAYRYQGGTLSLDSSDDDAEKVVPSPMPPKQPTGKKKNGRFVLGEDGELQEATD